MKKICSLKKYLETMYGRPTAEEPRPDPIKSTPNFNPKNINIFKTCANTVILKNLLLLAKNYLNQISDYFF